jgi:hypothetical protein
MSALDPFADVNRVSRHVRKMPTPEVAKVAQNKKPPEGGF